MFSLQFFSFFVSIAFCTYAEPEIDMNALRKEAHKMFMHGYNSYMNYAFPADELMPLSCKGRIRGITPSRGDVDDSLGNFSLTLIDTLDTLVVLNEFDEFERAVDLIIENVKFDADLVVSVFETNIRVLGGLISAHVMAELVRKKFPTRLLSYDNDLLKMAIEVGDRLLPAFNTTSGLPYSRINMKRGMQDHLRRQKDTCTACGGTMLLEMAALSRLSGNPIYETKARKAMDFLWQQRHRSSDLMGTVLNVHSGDWVRRESGIGAGIDSYYEYCLKAYILLGDNSYLDRFNKHYEAIMRFINKGPLFVDVHMHRPTVVTRGFMDSLLAFWPGLQVLKGDVKQAIEMHEMLFQVIQKHKFLPEAFTHDFQVHWAEHPIRPEFVESTYFLYRATKDPHYLKVAKQIMDSINEYVKVPCGFAALKDVRTMMKEDQMESFVLSETFKYLYLIFTDPVDLVFDPDHYVLTTEAHFLPLTIGRTSGVDVPRKVMLRSDEQGTNNYVCANPIDFAKLPTEKNEAQLIREKTKMLLGELKHYENSATQSMPTCVTQSERLRAWSFSATNADHIKQLAEMGIELVTLEDGRLHLSHQAVNAINPVTSRWGHEFMQEMMQYVEKLEKEELFHERQDRYVQLISYPHFGAPTFMASPAQFGTDLDGLKFSAKMAKARPYRACAPLTNENEIRGKVALVERSDCMFQEKARFAQKAGAIGMLVIDHQIGTEFSLDKPTFAMAGDKETGDDIAIPSLFVYHKEGSMILENLKKNPESAIMMTTRKVVPDYFIAEFFKTGKSIQIPNEGQCLAEEGDVIVFDKSGSYILFNLRFNTVNQDSEPVQHQEIVERHVTELQKYLTFDSDGHAFKFYEMFRNVAYGALGLNVEETSFADATMALKTLTFKQTPKSIFERLTGAITRIRCIPKITKMTCAVLSI